MFCSVCGKEFKSFVVRKTCSEECARRVKEGKWALPPIDNSGKCLVCGNKTPYKFCNSTCYLAYRDNSYKRELYTYPDALGTAGLIKKWYSEGDTPEDIARLLGRDIKVIREVLEDELV
jgi:predicted nucleic acid-binding Zn ribbon protein